MIDDVEIQVYASSALAIRAERGFDWIKSHISQLREQVRQQFPNATDEGAFADFRVSRKDNVIVTYPPAAEHRVRAALDRLH